MESKELIFATWVLVGFTGILALSTIAYAITTWMLYRGSQRQIEALNELTKGILQLPSITKHIQTQEEIGTAKAKRTRESSKRGSYRFKTEVTK